MNKFSTDRKNLKRQVVLMAQITQVLRTAYSVKPAWLVAESQVKSPLFI